MARSQLRSLCSEKKVEYYSERGGKRASQHANRKLLVSIGSPGDFSDPEKNTLSSNYSSPREGGKGYQSSSKFSIGRDPKKGEFKTY